MNLVTLAQLKRYSGIDPLITTDDALLTRLIIDAEKWAEATTQRAIRPVIETRTFDYCDPRFLYFEDDLLELITATNGDGVAVTLSDLAYEPRHLYPKFGISLVLNASVVWTFSTSPENAISLKAAWGYHDDWPHAWTDSLDKVTDAAGINDSVTTVTVGNVDGANVDTDSPRFSAGMLIKIESEWLEVITATNSTTDTLTVKRGALGSTAAAHAKDALIYTFSPARNIVGALLLYCQWRYQQKNERGTSINEVPKDITALLPYPVRTY